MKTLHHIIALSLILLSLSSCNFGGNEGNGRIVVNNNNKNLSGRVVRADEEIQLRNLEGQLGKTLVAAVPKDFRLILRAEVAPPVYEGFTLRATHVTINNDMAYVSYNREGEDYLGGVEIFDVSDVENPTLVSQAIFTDTDISMLAYDNNNLYLAGATNTDINPNFTSPAIVEKIGLNLLGELTDNSQISDVSSYVATGVAVFGDFIMATSGSDGHLTTLTKSELVKLDSVKLNDARSVATSDSYIASFGASPATLNVLDVNNPNIVNEYVIDGTTISESKSTLAIDGDYAYVSLNDGGLKVVKLSDGSIMQSIDKPETPIDEDDADYVTNAVSVNDELVFIANGAAGVYVGKKYMDSEIEIYGSADLNSSTNYVESNNNIVFVATGFGGFKILEIQHSEFSNPTIEAQEGPANFDYQYGGVKYNFANTNTREHYLGLGDLNIVADRVDANYTWSVPGEHTIRFEYDPLTHTMKSTINGTESVRSFIGTPPEYPLNTLEINVVERSNSASVLLKNLIINDDAFGSYEGDGWKNWTFSDIDVSEGFVITAIIQLDGNFPKSDEKDKISFFLGHVAEDTTDDVISEWQSSGKTYAIGDQVTYNGNVYECIQGHSTFGDPNWAPDLANSLWSIVDDSE